MNIDRRGPILEFVFVKLANKLHRLNRNPVLWLRLAKLADGAEDIKAMRENCVTIFRHMRYKVNRDERQKYLLQISARYGVTPCVTIWLYRRWLRSEDFKRSQRGYVPLGWSPPVPP